MIKNDRQENGFLPIRGGGPFNMQPGQITDDTELTMALARCVVEAIFEDRFRNERTQLWISPFF